MRIVFVGAGEFSVAAARELLDRGHEVILVDPDRERLESLSEHLDCGFLHGDGTRPDVLREVNPESCDVLECVANDDQGNIIASLVGKSLGFPRVVTEVEDEGLEHIASELGLESIVIPARAIGRQLADMVEGADRMELSSAVKGDAQVVKFVMKRGGPTVGDLGLPADDARVTHLYRDGRLVLPDADTELREGDELVLIARRPHVDRVLELLGPNGNDAVRA